MEDLHARIQELEATVKKLEGDLIHDHLTGLKTRAFFEEEARVYFDVLRSAEQNQRRQAWFGFKNLSFIILDIDFFKKINDTYGHQAGDQVLKMVAQVIRGSVRDGDTAARWGGEEFAVTLVGASESDARERAESIRHKVELLTFDALPDVKVTISAGVASIESGATLDEIFKRADQALYKAKEGGRNNVVVYSSL